MVDYQSLINRIEALETALSYQEKLVADLNAVLTEQQNMIHSLTPQVRELTAQLRDLRDRDSAGQAVNAASEKPPHY